MFHIVPSVKKDGPTFYPVGMFVRSEIGCICAIVWRPVSLKFLLRSHHFDMGSDSLDIYVFIMFTAEGSWVGHTQQILY